MPFPWGLVGGTWTKQMDFICNQHVKQYYNENYNVLIGTADTIPIGSSPGHLAQGANRYERAQNFYAFSDTNAIARGTTLLWQYDTVSNVGHNANLMYNTKASPLDSFTIAENMLFNTPWNPVPVFVPVANFNAADTLLTVTFTDSTLNAPSYWYWDFGDGDTSLVQNPVHTYSSSGIYYVCLTAGDSCVTDSYCDSVVIIAVGIDEASTSSNTQLNIQPNPFNETTTISFMLPETGNATVEVYNYMGQKVTELYNNFAEAGQLYKVKFNTEGWLTSRNILYGGSCNQ
ncbi:MAG: hypothetical protein COA97_11495 [Flavobacteriales bacterium]|nr:MAG: hypothetical protein COA97_11495 [Flavobacteriales bacterium]